MTSQGVLLSCGSGEARVAGFLGRAVAVDRGTLKKGTPLSKVVAEHQVLEVVVTGTAWLEAQVVCDARTATRDAAAEEGAVFSYEALTPGRVLTGRITEVGERRARVRIGPGVEGTVAPADMSEKALLKPHRTLKRGEERACQL